MGVKHMAHALFNSNKDGKTTSTSKGRKKKAHGDDDEGYIPEVDEESSSFGEDEFYRQQTHHENSDPPIITGIYEANEFGVQIKRIFPTEGFAHSWKDVDSTVKEAIMQAVKDKFQITDEDIAEDSELIEVFSDEKAYKIYNDWKHSMRKHYLQMKEEGLDAFAHPYPGVTNAGWRYLIDNIFDDEKFEAGPNKEWPEFCDLRKRTHTSSKTGTWANLERVRDEGIASGNPLTEEELSRIVLKPSKRHIKGFRTGPRPSSCSSKYDAKSLAQKHQIRELCAEIEESKKKDEEWDQDIANLKILVAQWMNGGGSNNRSSWYV
ncbi:hypothetical protein Dimus_023020 [Dionaea muscipula]